MGAQLNFDSEMDQIVLTAFQNTSKFIRMGALNLLFYLTAFYTCINGAFPLMIRQFPAETENMPESTEEVTNFEEAATEVEEDVPHFKLHVFFFVMPVAMALYHNELKRVCAKSEVPLVVSLKYLIVVYYLVMIVFAHFA